MKCTLCGHLNSEGATACRACKANLVAPAGNRPCARCKVVNQPGTLICAQCGDLVAGGPRGDPSLPSVLLPEPDRLARIAEEERDAALFPPDVLARFAVGQRVEAHTALRAGLGADAVRAPARERQLRDRRLWAEPCTPPGMFTINGLGGTCYGHDEPHPDRTFIVTYYIVVFFLPVYASAAYLVLPGERAGSWVFLARVPLSEGNRKVGWMAGATVLAALVVLAVLISL